MGGSGFVYSPCGLSWHLWPCVALQATALSVCLCVCGGVGCLFLTDGWGWLCMWSRTLMIHVLLLESLSGTVGNSLRCQGLTTVFVFEACFWQSGRLLKYSVCPTDLIIPSAYGRSFMYFFTSYMQLYIKAMFSAFQSEILSFFLFIFIAFSPSRSYFPAWVKVLLELRYFLENNDGENFSISSNYILENITGPFARRIVETTVPPFPFSVPNLCVLCVVECFFFSASPWSWRQISRTHLCHKCRKYSEKRFFLEIISIITIMTWRRVACD